MATDSPVPIRRGDLRGLALETYIPRRGRAARHYADSFSCALWLAKINIPLPGDGAGQSPRGRGWLGAHSAEVHHGPHRAHAGGDGSDDFVLLVEETLTEPTRAGMART